jgi:hypothetical protein
MRVVNWVHRNSSRLRALPEPPNATSLRITPILMIRIGNLANRRSTLAPNQAHLTRRQSQNHVSAIAPHNLHAIPGRPRKLAAAPNLHLNIMNHGSKRNIFEQHTIPRLNVCDIIRDNLIPNGQLVWRNNVAKFAIIIFNQRDKRRSIGVILNPRNLSPNAVFIPHKIYISIQPLMPTAPMTAGYVSMIIAPTTLADAMSQLTARPPLPEPRTIYIN